MNEDIVTTYMPELRWKRYTIWRGDSMSGDHEAVAAAKAMIERLTPGTTHDGQPALLISGDGAAPQMIPLKDSFSEWGCTAKPNVSARQRAAMAIAEMEACAALPSEWRGRVIVEGVCVWDAGTRATRTWAFEDTEFKLRSGLWPSSKMAKDRSGKHVPSITSTHDMFPDSAMVISEEAKYDTVLEAWRHAARALAGAAIEVEAISTAAPPAPVPV